MQLTANFGLKKPEANEYYNVEDFNENAEIIDEELKKAQDAAGSHAARHGMDGEDPIDLELLGAAPASHTHSVEDVEDLQSALDGKAASEHEHEIENITDLQDALDGKSDTDHAHTAAEVGALPSSGGTLTGDLNIRKYDNGYGALIKNHGTSADYGTQLRDYDADGDYVHLQLRASEQVARLLFSEGGTAKNYHILHSGNFSDYAVNKAGDTMSGDLTINRGTSFGSFVVQRSASDGSVGKNYMSVAIDGTTHLAQMMVTKDGTQQGAIVVGGDLYLKYKDILNGNAYDILHTGNLEDNGVAKIVTGSYIGTGTYGSANVCTLTFDSTPKLFAFTRAVQYDYTGAVSNHASMFHAYGFFDVSFLTTEYQEAYSGVFGGSNIALSEDGLSINWYSTADATEQRNDSNKEYFWVAIF